jgi:hypothetical protein
MYFPQHQPLLQHLRLPLHPHKKNKSNRFKKNLKRKSLQMKMYLKMNHPQILMRKAHQKAKNYQKVKVRRKVRAHL